MITKKNLSIFRTSGQLIRENLVMITRHIRTKQPTIQLCDMSDQKYLLTTHKMNERRMYDQKIKSYMISSVKEQLTWACSSRHGRGNNIQAWAYSSHHDGNHSLRHTTVIFGTYGGEPALPNLKNHWQKIYKSTKTQVM